MGNGSITLLSLPDELITAILTFCSAEELLALETTCKILRERCQDRAVWLHVLRDLPLHQVPDLPPTVPLASLSTADMKKIVINAITLAYNWNTKGNLKMARRSELKFDIRDPCGWVEARLLPGGQNILVENDGVLELWSLSNNKRIWTVPEDKECFSFDCELTENGKVLNIAGVFSTIDQEDVTLRVYSYNFDHHSSSLVFERNVPNAFLSRYMIRGDLFSDIVPFEPEIILINWKTGEGMVVRFVDPQVGTPIQCRVAVLASQHLVSFLDLNFFASVAIPCAALDKYWSKSGDYREWETVTFDPKEWSLLTEIDFNRTIFHDFPNGPWVLSVHEFRPTWMYDSPSELYVAVCDRIERRPENFIVYHLRLHADADNSGSKENTPKNLTFEGKSVLPAAYMPFVRNTFSNSGRVLNLQLGFSASSIFNGPVPQENQLVLDEYVATDANISVEPWSNAIIIGEPGRVRVIHLV